ncbi:hypothetical protein GGH19_004325 [Coemansia sp. RSA 1807]|nr:hypothetical protein GGH19_004325 [Coemansia sp. RSA 1807]
MHTSIEDLVAELTTSGSETLDTDTVNQLKRRLKHDESDQAIIQTFQALQLALEKRHAQVRLSALQLANIVFCRSHQFRLLVVDNLPRWFELVLGTNHKKLPAPVQYAQQLRDMAAEIYYMWVERFGNGYQRLVYGFRYLRFIEQVDFKRAVKEYKRKDPERIRARRKIRLEAQSEYLKRSLVSVQADYMRTRQSINEALDTLDNCFAILVPEIVDIFGSHGATAGTTNDDDDDGDLDEVLAIMAANRQSIDININPERVLEAEEDTENSAVFDVIRDYLRLCVQVYSPRVQIWKQKLDRIDDSAELAGLVDGLDTRISVAIEKCRDLGIDFAYMDEPRDDEEDTDEFEDAPAPVVNKQQRIRQVQQKRNSVFAMYGQQVLKQDPTYIDPSLLRDQHNHPQADIHQEEGPTNSVEAKLRETAPVVSYGADLEYWGQREVNANTTGLEIRHRFLGSARDEPMLSEAALDTLQKRAVYYQEPERKEIKACRALLPSGRLCPRRDLVKCPLHGAIVPRDEQGQLKAGFLPEEEAEAPSSSITTAERIEDLNQNDVNALARKQQTKAKTKTKAKKPKLASTRKAKLTGIKRLQQTISRKR